MTDTPRVSVYMASFNGARYVEEAVRSILGQSFKHLELVVVDDGSEETTLLILRRLAAEDARLKLYECKHRGLVGTLNHAISLCRGSYLARMDHDDVSVPHRIARQVQYLDSNPEVVACGSELRRMDSDGHLSREKLRRQRTLEHRPDLLPPRVSWMPGPTPMIRAAAMKRVGGYRPQFLAAEDRDLCWRLGDIGTCARLNEALLHYRGHSNNTSNVLRRTQLFSHLLGDMSAIARHFKLDDSKIVDTIVPGGDYSAPVTAYRILLGAHYPVDTFWYHFLLRHGAWMLGGYNDPQQFREEILRHWRKSPFGSHRTSLMLRALLPMPVKTLQR